MRFYFDTEFLDDGRIIDLISIGIINADGETYYAVSADFDESTATDWLRKHVLNHIPRLLRRKPRTQIAQEVSDFLHGPGLWDKAVAPEIWGWYPAYDWVALCQLYGPMIARPPHFPKRPNDLKQLAESRPGIVLPRQEGTKHHPLEDAKWVKNAHETILNHPSPYSGWCESDNPLTHVPRGATGL